MAADEGRRPARLRGGLLATLGALSAFGPVSLDLYLPAFPSIAQSLGVATGDVQLTFSASLLGLGVGQLVYGPLADRFGRKPPLVAGLVLFVVASLLCAVSPSLSVLVGLRLLQGLGGCAGLVIARAIVRDCFDGPALARSYSVITSVAMLAPLIAPGVGALILWAAGWRAVFVVIAAFGVACLLATWRLPETLPVERRLPHGVGDALRGYRGLVRQRRFVVPASVVALSSGTLMAYLSSSSTVMMDGFGVPAGWFAVLVPSMALCYIVGLRLNMTLVGRYPTEVLLRAYLAVEVPAAVLVVVLFVVGAPLWAVLVGLGVVIGCIGGTLPTATAATMRPFGANAGSASALLGTVQMGLAGIVAATLAAVASLAPAALTPGLIMSVAMVALAGVASVLVWSHRPS